MTSAAPRRSTSDAAADRSAAAADFTMCTLYVDLSHARMNLSGKLDRRGGELFTAAMTEHLRAGRLFVQVHLAGMTDIDRFGATALVRVHAEFLAAGGRMLLTGLGERARGALQLDGRTETLLIATAPESSAAPAIWPVPH